ncbi:NAD(P)-binding protein [Poronia punctata]|nr:NAD(P)-binding protein [Poronia punctata]
MPSGLLYQIYMKWFPIPLPPADSFEGKSALITGGTSGLGLAAAAHLVNLGATEVIITSRDPSRGAETVLAELARETSGRSKGVVSLVKLDMNRYDSVVACVEEVKKKRMGRGGLDLVILNAGVLGTEHTVVDEGWEQNLQVNVLSTTLLALLLLPWMKSEHASSTSSTSSSSSPPHIVIVGSGQHIGPDIKTWNKNKNKNGVLAYYNNPTNWPGPRDMYAATKLMVHYASREIAELAKGKDGRPEVIVNTTCPGMVRTGLARHYTGKSRVFDAFIAAYMGLAAKTPENGARTLIAAARTKEGEHGKFIRFYGSEEDYRKQANIIFESDEGSGVQSSLWSEITSELAAKVPTIRHILSSYTLKQTSTN